MRKVIRRLLYVMFALLVVLASCGGEEEEMEAEELEPSPLPVTASTASVDTLFAVVSSTGRISSARTQTLSAQIQGEVVQAPEHAGQEVSDGEVVFRIASGESASRLSSSSSAYRNAQALYEFECENYRGELTPEVKNMLRQTTGLADAQTALASAQTQYNNSAIKAGFNGVVSNISAREGMTVYPGTSLGEIIDPWSLQAKVSLDERALARCEKNQRVYVTFPSLNDTTVVGTVLDRTFHQHSTATPHMQAYTALCSHIRPRRTVAVRLRRLQSQALYSQHLRRFATKAGEMWNLPNWLSWTYPRSPGTWEY